MERSPLTIHTRLEWRSYYAYCSQKSSGVCSIGDKETAKATLYIELSKPPLLQDLVKLIEEKAPLGRVAALEAHRSIQAKLALVKNLEELDIALLDLLTIDLENAFWYLPDKYARILSSLAEAYELEVLYSKIASRIPDEKPLRYAKLVDYANCTNRFSGIISKHLSKIKAIYSEIDEYYYSALGVAGLLDAFLYARYLNNLKALKLGEDVAMRDLIIDCYYFEPGVARLLEALRSGRDPLEAWVNGVQVLYDVAKSALYYTNRLVDLVTLYGVDRVLRYKLLRVIYSRWLKPW
jgi:hypothetical protein